MNTRRVSALASNVARNIDSGTRRDSGECGSRLDAYAHPCDALYESGRIRTAKERRAFDTPRFTADDRMSMLSTTEFDGFARPHPSHSDLELKADELARARQINHIVFISQSFVFRLLECIEYTYQRVAKPMLGSYASSTERSAPLLSVMPPLTRAMVIKQIFPALDRVFPVSAWGVSCHPSFRVESQLTSASDAVGEGAPDDVVMQSNHIHE